MALPRGTVKGDVLAIAVFEVSGLVPRVGKRRLEVPSLHEETDLAYCPSGEAPRKLSLLSPGSCSVQRTATHHHRRSTVADEIQSAVSSTRFTAMG